MKKLYILLIFSTLLSNASAQSYFPILDSISNIWYYSFNMIPVRAPQNTSQNCTYGFSTSSTANTFSTIGDTLINNLTYKILLQQEYNMTSDCIYGYLREDTTTKQIYFLDNQFQVEELIYDFSMVPGDSIYLDFYQPFGYYTSGFFHLDSIGTVTIPAGNRRLFFLNNHQATSMMPLEWVESVGHPGHLIYTKSGNSFGGLFANFCFDQIDRNFYQQLTCFEHSSQKVYFDSCAHATAVNNGCFFYADSCYYWNICGSIEEPGSIASLSIAPNPIKYEGQILVDGNRESLAQIFIYGTDGRQLYNTKKLRIHNGLNKIPIQTYDYRHGVYVVELRFDKGSLYRKMIIIN